MGYNYGKKKSPIARAKAGLTSAFRKVALVTAVAAVPAVPVAYSWSTVQHDTVTVTDYTYNKDGKEGYHVIYTDHGTFNIEPSRLHLQSKEDTTRMMRDVYRGTTFDVTSYGYHLGLGWQPNIYNMRKVSAQELEQRQRDRQAQSTAQPAQAQNQNQQQQPRNGAPAAAATGALSGQMVTTTVTVNGYAVDITLPVEAAGKVSIASVKPVVATPAPVAPPPQM